MVWSFAGDALDPGPPSPTGLVPAKALNGLLGRDDKSKTKLRYTTLEMTKALKDFLLDG